MSRECGSADLSPLLRELRSIRQEQQEQRQAIKVIGNYLFKNGSPDSDSGYQEVGLGSLASAGAKIGKILTVITTVAGAVENIKTLVETFTGSKTASGDVPEDIKLLHMIKRDTAIIGGRTKATEDKLALMERKVNDMLFVVNKTRPEIALIPKLESKVNDTLFIVNRTRPEIAKIVPMEKKVNDSLFVLNTIRPEIKEQAKKANDAAYAATQASIKADKILLAIAALAVKTGIDFAASDLKIGLAIIASTTAILKAKALQTTTILAAITASGLREVFSNLLNTAVENLLNRLLSQDKNDTGLILKAIEQNTSFLGKELTTRFNQSAIHTEKTTAKQTDNLVVTLKRECEAILIKNNDRLVTAIDKLIKPTKNGVTKIYQILGGAEWGAIEASTFTELQPERSIKSIGNTIFAGGANGRIKASNLIQLIYSVATPQYYRTGLHRLPAKVPSSIHYKQKDKGNVQQIDINSLVDFQNWQFSQLDSALGAYPIEIKYKNDKGEDKELVIQNQAEMQSEMMGLMLNLASESDLHTELLFKNIAEIIKTGNTAIYTSDHVQAISEFLGYRGTEVEREVPLQVNPSGKTLKEMLQPSKKKIAGWENKDKADLMEHVKRLLFYGSIIHSVFYKTTGVPGDGMKDAMKNEDKDKDGQETKQKKDWDDFVNTLRNPPTYLKDPTDPVVKIKDYSNLRPGENPDNP